MEPTALSLDDLTGGGITAVFLAGATALSHRWELLSQTDVLLARTARVHNGGGAAQLFWKAMSATGLDTGNDIHVELRGADDRPLVRISSIHDKPAVVTAVDGDGRQVAQSKREKDALTLFGHDDQVVAELTCTGDGPWAVQDGAQNLLGELLARTPGPSLSPSLWEWIDPKMALNSATYARTQHLGLRRVVRYAFAPADSASAAPVALALLPLLAGLTY